jgi:CubicO group peptidase (beta-lactamase class C family)
MPRAAPSWSGATIAAVTLLGCGSPTGFEVSARCLPEATEAFESALGIPGRMAYYRVPGVSIAIVRDGAVAFARGYGVTQSGSDECVDPETAFSVGSLSKVAAATVTLTLVDDGVLDLDGDVDPYLTRWAVPANGLTQAEPVTLRRIMSHTAGFNVPGFANYQPQEPVPTILDILDGRPPAKNAPIRVTLLPGSAYRYSGGGVMVEQLAIEDVTGLSLDAAARQRVFDPLGMTRSTYENPLPAAHGNIAKAHGPSGSPTALPRGWETMPEEAAAGLWTTPSDLGRLIVGLIDSFHGEPGAVLSVAAARDMMTRVAPSDTGLGPGITVTPAEIVFSHGGANDSYHAAMYGLLNARAGVVVATNGANGQGFVDEVVRGVWNAEGWPSY